MKKRISYYVRANRPLTWLAALSLVAAAGVRIANVCGKGVDAETMWLQTILPVVGCLLFVLMLFLDGKERFYRTAIPVFFLAAACGFRQSAGHLSLSLDFVVWIACLAIAAVYDITVSGKLRNNLLLLVLLAATLAVWLYTYRVALSALAWELILPELPDLLAVLGVLLAVLAMQPYLDGLYHPIWGDRSDGRKLRTLDPMQVVGNYIMPDRCGANVIMSDSLEVSALDRLIREKRKEGMAGLGITHFILAAYVRCVAKYPGLNRFLAGQQVYTHGDDIQFCMTVKSEMSTKGEESLIKLHLKPTDTVDTIYKKLNDEIERIKSNPVGDSDFDKTAKLMSFIPGVVFKFVVWLLRVLDYFGLIPKFLLEVSPFHASVFFTSMGSLGIPPVIHHLYSFGNMPIFISFGCKRSAVELNLDNEPVHRKYVDYTVDADERIVDGFYFAMSMKYLKRLIAHPEKLFLPPEEVLHDID